MGDLNVKMDVFTVSMKLTIAEYYNLQNALDISRTLERYDKFSDDEIDVLEKLSSSATSAFNAEVERAKKLNELHNSDSYTEGCQEKIIRNLK